VRFDSSVGVPNNWVVGREADCSGLLNRRSVKTWSRGSNPLLPAKVKVCMNFTIVEEYITQITVRTVHRDPDPEKELINRLRYGECVSIGSADHPEFAKLRDELEANGFISTSRNSWNGDRVLKPFTLNGHKFKKNERFLSGAAMKYHLESARKKRK
jgi:hypothetical protein